MHAPWEPLAPFAFLAGQLGIASGESEGGGEEKDGGGSRLAWWLVGIMTAVAAYFAVQFTGQLRADVSDLQASRSSVEIRMATAASEREGIRAQLSSLGALLQRLDAKLERLEENGYRNNGGRPR